MKKENLLKVKYIYLFLYFFISLIFLLLAIKFDSNIVLFIFAGIFCFLCLITCITGYIIFCDLNNSKRKKAFIALSYIHLDFFSAKRIKKISEEELSINILKKLYKIKYYRIFTYLSLLSYFSFFFKGLVAPDGNYLTFGTVIGENVPGLTAMLVLHLIALLSSLFLCTMFEFKSDETTIKLMKISCIINSILFFISSILSFCTVPLIYGTISSSPSLGAGPILFGLIGIISSIGFVFALYKFDSSLFKNIFKNTTKFSERSLHEQSINGENYFVVHNQANEESEKIKLMKEYKNLLDDGIISKEQFDKKIQDLLDK